MCYREELCHNELWEELCHKPSSAFPRGPSFLGTRSCLGTRVVWGTNVIARSWEEMS